MSVTPAADADGRDRNVDWFYHGLESPPRRPPTAARAGGCAGRGRRRAARRTRCGPADAAAAEAGALPYWGKYVFHDNNRDINLSLIQMRAIADWYFTAHPPIMHDLHESEPLMYIYSGGPPQNPESRSDPLLRAAVVRRTSRWRR